MSSSSLLLPLLLSSTQLISPFFLLFVVARRVFCLQMHWGIRLNGFEYIFFIKAPSLKWLCMCLSYTHLFEAFWVFFSWILCHSVSPLVSGVRYASFAERWNNNKWKGESRVTTVNWLILLRAERGRESEQNLWIGSSAWNHEKTTHTHTFHRCRQFKSNIWSNGENKFFN